MNERSVADYLLSQARERLKQSESERRLIERFTLLIATMTAVTITLSTWAHLTSTANQDALDDATHQVRQHRADQRALLEASLSLNTVGGGEMVDKRPSVLSPDWVSLAAEALPTVVAVSTLSTPDDGGGSEHPGWALPGTRRNALTDLYAFFERRTDAHQREESLRQQSVSCGGFSAGNNLIITAAHCVEDIEALRIRVGTGEWLDAVIVGSDQHQDIAVLRYEGASLPTLPFADALPRQGEAVMALGSPAGYGFAVGIGIVAWHGLDGVMFKTDDFMMVTASIIGGNSGGVVINARGEAVSVVSYGHGSYTQTVPIQRAMDIARFLVAQAG